MPPKRKEKKRKNRITYLSARSVKAVDCDDAWNSTYARPKALRPWRPPDFLPSFLPLVWSTPLPLELPHLRATCSSTALQSPSYTYPSCSLRNLFFSPQLLLDPLRTPNSPSPSPTLANLFRFVSRWLYSSISCLPVTWFVDNLFGNSVIPSTNKSAPAVKKFSALRMAEEEEEEEL